ncbi:MAG: hypothetical protein MRT15_04000 [archaeon YNP-LCB-003-016]|uniref:hypothetical protein n=1 Tax=Candidatus Culexarchaeum yellowstonense TaxID=2928963 RepID=UPI0026F1887D|nr:hypothetical protein [Candidatus Culexarchaeum yellowstonense]MCR6691531.1 hypothetical protein [Candidatus Culexarchaeum yellowstonense]
MGEEAKVKTTVAERINKFKELIKQGKSVRKAMMESGLQPRDYKKHYDEIWSDPEIAAFKPQPRVRVNPPQQLQQQKETSKPEDKPEDKNEEKKGEEPKGLEELLSEETLPFEKEYLELKRREQAMVAAAYRILSQYGVKPPGSGPQPTPPSTQPPPTTRKEAIEDFLEAVKAYEEKREKVKEALEKMGFKLEDKYMSREEVERLIEDVKRKTAEETLDDKRIDAVQKIISDAIAQVISLFKPVIEKYFGASLEAGIGGATQQAGQTQRELKPQST